MKGGRGESPEHSEGGILQDVTARGDYEGPKKLD